MATYADLKARIIAETHRDDLADELATILDIHVADAVDRYATNSFWFNQKIATVTTVAGNASLAVPAGFRTVSRVTGKYGDLRAVGLDEALETTSQGYPGEYAYYNDALRLFPTPGEAYNLTFYGLAEIPAPALDTDDNVWTNEAFRLIAAEARSSLCRDVFKDANGSAAAMVAANAALNALTTETWRRQDNRLFMKSPRSSGSWATRRVGV